MKAKRTLKLTLCLFTVLILLLPILSSCSDSAPKLTIEEMQEETVEGTVLTFSEMQDRVKICIDHNNRIPFSISEDRNGSIWTGYDYNDPNYAPIPAEKYTYRGVEYNISGGEIRRYPMVGYPDTIYSFSAKEDNGNKVRVKFTDMNKTPIRFFSSTTPIYGAPKESFGEADIIQIAKDYIVNCLNKEYIDKIEIDKYTLTKVEISETNIAHVYFERYVNGIFVHRITVCVNEHCQIKSFDMQGPIVDEETLKQIPNFTKEQYIELIRPTIEQIYRNENEEFSIDNFGVDGELNGLGGRFELQYLQNLKCYAVSITPEFTVTLPDGRSEEPAFLCFYPLYPNTENAD